MEIEKSAEELYIRVVHASVGLHNRRGRSDRKKSGFGSGRVLPVYTTSGFGH